MSETEKLLMALMGIKETCELLGAETIEIENEMEDGTIKNRLYRSNRKFYC